MKISPEELGRLQVQWEISGEKRGYHRGVSDTKSETSHRLGILETEAAVKTSELRNLQDRFDSLEEYVSKIEDSAEAENGAGTL